MVIRIKQDKDLQAPERHGDWIDLRAARDTFIPLFECRAVPLGVRMQLPDGCEAIVAPRSSTFKHFGVIAVNGIGIIDNAYCGNDDEWHFLAYCLQQKTVVSGKPGVLIKKGERICQFRILHSMPEVQLYFVDDMPGDSRGGIGSTGR